MPKESYKITSFDKGLITAKDSRDIEEASLSMSWGMDFNVHGKSKMLGSFEPATDDYNYNENGFNFYPFGENQESEGIIPTGDGLINFPTPGSRYG